MRAVGVTHEKAKQTCESESTRSVDFRRARVVKLGHGRPVDRRVSEVWWVKLSLASGVDLAISLSRTKAITIVEDKRIVVVKGTLLIRSQVLLMIMQAIIVELKFTYM